MAPLLEDLPRSGCPQTDFRGRRVAVVQATIKTKPLDMTSNRRAQISERNGVEGVRANFARTPPDFDRNGHRIPHWASYRWVKVADIETLRAFLGRRDPVEMPIKMRDLAPQILPPLVN
jgi:hypothetical protein